MIQKNTKPRKRTWNSQEQVSLSTAPSATAGTPTVLEAHGDVLPGSVDGGDRRRWEEEGDGCPVFVRLVFNPFLTLEYVEDVTLDRHSDEELVDLLPRELPFENVNTFTSKPFLVSSTGSPLSTSQ